MKFHSRYSQETPTGFKTPVTAYIIEQIDIFATERLQLPQCRFMPVN